MPKANRAQLALKEEATPGTAETLTSSEVQVRLREGFAINPDQEIIDLEEIQENSSQSLHVAGRSLLTIVASYNLRGPGDLTTTPAIEDLLESALFLGATAKTIAIGAVTGGPFQAGEIITGATSSATGRVTAPVYNGATDIPYIPISGTLQSAETIDGGTSKASATSSAGPADGGRGYEPTDPDLSVAGHHVTAGLYRDGMRWLIRGALSDLNIAFSNGGPAIVTQNLSGAHVSTTDTALLTLTGGAYPEDAQTPGRFLNAGLNIDNVLLTGLTECTFNWPTNAGPIEDANSTAADGVDKFDYDRQGPTITLTCDQIDVATLDLFGKLGDGAQVEFVLTHGSTAGSQWSIGARPQVRRVQPAQGEPNRATFEVELGLTGTDNNEVYIRQH